MQKQVLKISRIGNIESGFFTFKIKSKGIASIVLKVVEFWKFFKLCKFAEPFLLQYLSFELKHLYFSVALKLQPAENQFLAAIFAMAFFQLPDFKFHFEKVFCHRVWVIVHNQIIDFVFCNKLLNVEFMVHKLVNLKLVSITQNGRFEVLH